MQIRKSNQINKKFQTKTPSGKTIHFGAKGYTIKRGTDAGDSYCARSFGILDGMGNPTRNDPEKANYYSRKMWGCKRKKSIK